MFGSTVGAKFLVAITGLALTGFVIVHMLGNLQIFLGREAINEYAHKLKSLGPLLWVARLSLLAIFVIHIWLAIRLKLRSAAHRPTGYAYERTVQASFASRTMIYSGLLILAFVLFHIAHFTLGLVQSAPTAEGGSQNMLDLHDPTKPEYHDVYRMMIIGLSNPIIAGLYIIAQIILMLHMSHGVASTFQSLGLNTPRTQSAFQILGWAVTLLVGGGNIAIVLAVWLGLLPS